MRLRSFAAAVGLIAGLIATSAPAWAHGDLQEAKPAEGRHLTKPPKVIELSFREPVATGSEFEVTDGCREDVPALFSGTGRDVRLEINGGAPGLWKVDYTVVSGADGHPVSGSYSFHVGNKKPCDAVASPTLAAPPPVANDDGGGFPATPVLIGGAAVVALAVVIRVISAQ